MIMDKCYKGNTNKFVKWMYFLYNVILFFNTTFWMDRNIEYLTCSNMNINLMNIKLIDN